MPEGKIKEHGVGVTLSPLSKEYHGDIYTYLLFKADNTAFQKYLKEIEGQKSTHEGQTSTHCCCDIICFALQKSLDQHKSKRKITICLVELKGGKQDYISKASKQILETRTWLEEGIRRCIDEKGINNINITWQALIISRSSLSKETARNREDYRKMAAKFNKADYTCDNMINLVEYMSGKRK